MKEGVNHSHIDNLIFTLNHTNWEGNNIYSTQSPKTLSAIIKASSSDMLWDQKVQSSELFSHSCTRDDVDAHICVDKKNYSALCCQNCLAKNIYFRVFKILKRKIASLHGKTQMRHFLQEASASGVNNQTNDGPPRCSCISVRSWCGSCWITVTLSLLMLSVTPVLSLQVQKSAVKKALQSLRWHRTRMHWKRRSTNLTLTQRLTRRMKKSQGWQKQSENC